MILKEIAKMTRAFDDYPKSEGMIFTVDDATNLYRKMGQIALMIKVNKATRVKKFE